MGKLEKKRTAKSGRGLTMLKIALLAIILNVGSVITASAQKHGAPAPTSALVGRVRSDAEGAMEGVLVRAKGEGKTISVTVITNHEGRYSFPANRLAPGKFKIDIRAVGYELASPISVGLAADVTRRMDLKLVKTKDLVPQLTSSEWLM